MRGIKNQFVIEMLTLNSRITPKKDPCWRENEMSFRCLDRNGECSAHSQTHNILNRVHYTVCIPSVCLELIFTFQHTTRPSARLSLKTTETAKGSGTVSNLQGGRRWVVSFQFKFRQGILPLLPASEEEREELRREFRRM